MPILNNPRHEAYAQALASGKSAQEAYELAGFSKDRGNASRLRADADIKARVAEIQGAAAAEVQFTLADAIRWCVGVVKALPTSAGAENELCEMRMGKDGPYYVFPDKLKALQVLASLSGWEDQESQQSGEPTLSWEEFWKNAAESPSFGQAVTPMAKPVPKLKAAG